jgi:hypothetical protein
MVMKLLVDNVNINPWAITTNGKIETGVIIKFSNYDEEDIIDQLLQHLSKDKILEIIDKLEEK